MVKIAGAENYSRSSSLLMKLKINFLGIARASEI